MAEQPMVSVIVPLYNAESTIERCLDSILAQQCDFPFQILVGDDCSSDNSRAILQRYAHANPDKVVAILNQNNLGVIGNYCSLVDQATGKYLAFCDNDDFWHNPEKLQKQVAILDANPQAVMTYGDFNRIDESAGVTRENYRRNKGDHPPSGNIYETILLRNYIGAVTVCCRTSEARQALRDINMAQQTEWTTPDYPLWLALCARGEAIYLDESLATYWLRTHSTSQSDNRAKRSGFTYGIWKIREYFINRYPLSRPVKQKALENGANLQINYYFYNKKYVELRTYIDNLTVRPSSRRSRVISYCSRHGILLHVLKFLLRP